MKRQEHKRSVTVSTKRRIAGRQNYKCNNSPNKNLKGLYGHKCSLWGKKGITKGSFDESGYDIDHIEEYIITHDDSDENLQALCKQCHRVKTDRFNSIRREHDKIRKEFIDIFKKYNENKKYKVGIIGSYYITSFLRKLDDNLKMNDNFHDDKFILELIKKYDPLVFKNFCSIYNTGKIIKDINIIDYNDCYKLYIFNKLRQCNFNDLKKLFTANNIDIYEDLSRSSRENAFCTIRNALEETNSLDKLKMKFGFYYIVRNNEY